MILLSRANRTSTRELSETTEVRVLAERPRVRFEEARGVGPGKSSDTVLTMHRGQVQVTNQVTGYKRFSVYGGEHLGNEPMPMPRRCSSPKPSGSRSSPATSSGPE